MPAEVSGMVVSAFVGLLTVVVVPLVGWLLAARWRETDQKVVRIETKLDAIPGQFAQVHARISESKENLASLSARLDTHLNDVRRRRDIE